MTTALLDLNRTITFRGSAASNLFDAAARAEATCLIPIEGRFTGLGISIREKLTEPIPDPEKLQLTPVQEMCHAPPAWLWHYLRRSNMVKKKSFKGNNCKVLNLSAFLRATVRQSRRLWRHS